MGITLVFNFGALQILFEKAFCFKYFHFPYDIWEEKKQDLVINSLINSQV